MDQGRFKNLVHRYKDRVYTFAFYFLGNREDAEDAAQEVLVKIWERGDTADPERMDGWVATVSRNVCVDISRRRKRWRSETWEGSQGVDPENGLIASEARGYIEQAILRLPDHLRGVLILRDVQGFSYREICEIQGISLSQLKVSLYRARKRLRDLLEPYYLKEWCKDGDKL
jgi:RNA polymerase sigma-70 factor (ECF subfamily)